MELLYHVLRELALLDYSLSNLVDGATASKGTKGIKGRIKKLVI